MRVRIILVEPHEAGNVGAAARAMKNFGFRDLVIVGPRPQRVDDISDWWARGAVDVVEQLRHVDTLAAALADVHLSIATTAVRGRHVAEQLTPFEVARLAEEALSDEHTLALVFGREEWGLSGPEIAICQRTASIQTSPDFPTMNLAQSVGIFCYELAKGLRRAARANPSAPRGSALLRREESPADVRRPAGPRRPGRPVDPRSIDAPIGCRAHRKSHSTGRVSRPAGAAEAAAAAPFSHSPRGL
jgi:tRNA/rRNA methyltransferase